MAKRSSRRRRKERGGAGRSVRSGEGTSGFKRVRRVPGGVAVLELLEFTVSYAPLPDPAREALPEKVKERLAQLRFEFETDVRLVMEELKYYAAKYPEVPLFENWLAKGLHDLGRLKEARALAERTLKGHPDYLSGKLMAAEFALRDGDLARAAELLGNPRNPQRFAPGRRVFHASELVGYFYLCAELDLRDGAFESARSLLGVIEKIAPDYPIARRLRERCVEAEREAGCGRRPIAAA